MVIIVLAISTLIIKISFLKPEDLSDSHKGLQKEVAESLKSEIKVGLNFYKSKFGHYPITSSKYYLDSIIEFVKISPVYIYQDIEVNGVKKSINNSGLKESNLYVGSGNSENVIKYFSTNGTTYELLNWNESR